MRKHDFARSGGKAAGRRPARRAADTAIGPKLRGAPVPFIAIRLWPGHHRTDAEVRRLLGLLLRHPGCCDEVWLCTGMGFPALREHRRQAGLMARAAARFRDAGIGVGLQVANTLGHADMPMCPTGGLDWPGRMVGPAGQVARMCNCPRDPALHRYLREMTSAYAAFQPSSVWIDDDLRMNSHEPVPFGCFCDRCVAAFSDRQGRAWDRKSLAAAMNSAGEGRLRLAWGRFNQESLAGVARTIAEAVRAAAPRCRVALQHCGHDWTVYHGPDWTRVFRALAEACGVRPGSRPGGGFYVDHRPREMLNKAADVGRQVARLPAYVEAVCPEIENFTHNSMGKSAHGTVVESALDLAFGCNCLSYAILCSGHDTTEWYGALLERIAAWRPFLERYALGHAGTVPGGLEVVSGRSRAARRLGPGEQPFAWTRIDLGRVYQLMAIGVPMCMGPAGAAGVILHAAAADGMTDGELRLALARGVVTDGVGLRRLQERALGVSLGARALPGPDDCRERLTDDPLNGAHAGKEWTVNMFGGAGERIVAPQPSAGNARVLGEYVNSRGRRKAAATVLVETGPGGRLSVLGYDGFEGVVSTARRAQWLAAADWAARGRLPVLIETAAQVVPVARVRPGGALRSVLLLNASIDASPPLALRLRSPEGNRAVWVSPTAPDRPLPAAVDRGEMSVRVPPMAPWSVGCVWLRAAERGGRRA